MGFRILLVAVILALRAFGQPPMATSAVDAPPPTAEARVAAAADTAGDAPADDPSDLDDDDDDSDDVALPARIMPGAPPSVAVVHTWFVRSLADKDTRRPLFRPPRNARVS